LSVALFVTAAAPMPAQTTAIEAAAKPATESRFIPRVVAGGISLGQGPGENLGDRRFEFDTGRARGWFVELEYRTPWETLTTTVEISREAVSTDNAWGFGYPREWRMTNAAFGFTLGPRQSVRLRPFVRTLLGVFSTFDQWGSDLRFSDGSRWITYQAGGGAEVALTSRLGVLVQADYRIVPPTPSWLLLRGGLVVRPTGH
jgi:hypothetical protein